MKPHLYTFNGRVATLTEWSHRVGISRNVLEGRLRQGWTFERAITTSVRKHRTAEEIALAQTKRCGTCLQEKSLSDFHRSSVHTDGRKTSCRTCRNQANREYPLGEERYIRQRERYARQSAIIREAKDRHCNDCGHCYPLPVMCFHHRNPQTKIKEVAKMVNTTEERLRAEIAKCDVLCSNCHILRHLNDDEN